MFTLPGKNSITPLFTYIQTFLRKTYAWLFIFFLGWVLLQPHKFQVAAAPEDAIPENMQEIYTELMQSAKQETANGDIQYEMLITLEGDDDTITYTVAPGDTLSEIAKLFGTTSNAIREANELYVGQVIRVGQKLKIAYDKSIIYDVEKEMSVADFATTYNINIDDLMTLNYFTTSGDVMEVGQQIFVPLNRVEAEERGLIKKKAFVMLDLPEKTVDEELLGGDLSGNKQPNKIVSHGEIDPWYDQVIITAEQTQQHLEALEQAKKEALLAEAKAVELAKQAEEARIKAEADKATEEARQAQLDAERKAEEARLAKIESEKKAEILKKAKEEEEARLIAEREAKQAAIQATEDTRLRDIAESCGDTKCYHEGKCWSKPDHAICAPNDPDNAWVCEDTYIDTGKSCISTTVHDEIIAQATGPKQTLDVLDQRYFNPYKDGYGGNGRAGGHCTMYVGRWLWKKLGKHTEWRGNAKYRYDNASAAGWNVGQTPKINSVIVMKYGSQGWNGYGHVGMVLKINWDARQVLIEDMNYVGRYVVSQHWVDMDSSKNPIIGYIYP